MAGIFNREIFNDAIFNTAAVAVAQQASGGGWLPPNPRRPYRLRVEEEVRKKREALGEIPKRVSAAIAKVARQSLADEIDVAVESALHRELDRLRLAYRAKYAEILRLEIEAQRIAKARRDDDEIAVLLLM